MGADTKLWPVKRDVRGDVGNKRVGFHFVRKLAGNIANSQTVVAGHYQRNRPQPILIGKPIPNVWHCIELAANGQFQFALRGRTIGPRGIIDDQQGPADLARALRCPTAVDEHALYFRPFAQASGDTLRHFFCFGLLRAGRQFDRQKRSRGILRRQEAVGEKRDAPNRCRKEQQSHENSDEVVPDRPSHDENISR
jgi:hypothetical protein